MPILPIARVANAHGGAIPDSFFDLNKPSRGIDSPYSAFWLLGEFFQGGKDTTALAFIREKWDYLNRDTIIGTLTESFGGGELCHNNGAIPAYFLLSKVLGVSERLPLSSKMITIKPMLGNLSEAEGTVVTAHGPVLVKWAKIGSDWSFRINLPPGTLGQVILPQQKSNKKLMINNKESKFIVSRGYIIFPVNSAIISGSYQ
jgi:hypothetical protein